jgi:uncharacterized membrane protein
MTTTTFDYGPIEFVLLGFDRALPTAGVINALEDLIESGEIRLLDLVIVSSDGDGVLSVTEIEDVSDEYGFGTIELEASGIAADDDIREFASELPADSAAVVLVVELVWAKKLAAALANSNGFVIHSDRIPAPIVNAAMHVLTTEG